MAIISKVVESKLKLELQNGMNEKGEDIIKSKTFSNISPSAEDSDLYDVGEILGNLQELPVMGVSRVNQIQMTKED